MIFDAASRSLALRSFIFTSAISRSCERLIVPALTLPGSAETGKVSAGTIRRSQLRDIAEVKMKDLNANDLDAAAKIIEGSARAMGLQVVEG